MILCPKCKEEIDDDSRYCDQCGQELFYCSSCSRVGVGRRCTYCGAPMVSYEELKKASASRASVSVNAPFVTVGSEPRPAAPVTPLQKGVPALTLYNPSLDIRLNGINGAVIGRRQGPYQKLFENNMYISGVHAQLIYKPDSGWCIIDKHSSNGTKLNQRDLQPDVPMSVKSGDIVTLANINLQVSVS
ncbi:MAG: FHA domain-containing protein [Prevotella sp.]|nr:FHA domain-containing protein [Prevotella sp.]